MKINRVLLLAAGLGLGGMGLAAPSASAMPMNGLDPALATSADAAQGVENVRWVCGPYRCRWVRGWRYWGPRPYWNPYYYGYYRPWWLLRRYYW